MVMRDDGDVMMKDVSFNDVVEDMAADETEVSVDG